MKSFEDELRSALGKRIPPEGFSDRVMAAMGPRRQHPGRWWLAAAAALVLILAGVIERDRTERMEAQAASEELVRAVEIVNAKLDGARQRVIEIGDSQWDTERKSQRP